MQEVTPLIYQLLSSAGWWSGYGASPVPPGTPYFTALLWRRASVRDVSPLAELPFENSKCGGVGRGRSCKAVGAEKEGS